MSMSAFACSCELCIVKPQTSTDLLGCNDMHGCLQEWQRQVVA